MIIHATPAIIEAVNVLPVRGAQAQPTEPPFVIRRHRCNTCVNHIAAICNCYECNIKLCIVATAAILLLLAIVAYAIIG